MDEKFTRCVSSPRMDLLMKVDSEKSEPGIIGMPHWRRKMRSFLYSVLTALMCLGLYTILQASARERDQQAEQAQKIEHCKQVNEQVIRESDEIIAKGKFPSQDQQDNWRQLSEPCKEARG